MVGKQTRPTVVNWPNQLRSIIDGYENAKGIVHGVQKDAIQNGWDARINLKGRDWKFTFQLIETPSRKYLLMTDEGTTGLTGKVLEPHDLEQDLPEKERWGRFENLAFTKESTEEKTTLGSRGRGKFIFLGASKTREIIYDSLRDDGTYRFGVRRLVTIASPTYSWDEAEGRETLLKMTENVITPLNKTGTRVIIVDPIDELVEAIKSGEFLNNIQETWWEIIQKYNAEVYIIYKEKVKKAEVPSEFILPENDDKYYKVLIKGPEKIKVRNTEFKLKKLHIVSAINKEISQDLQGISIQRGGMKVTTISPSYLPRELTVSIYGYIALDIESEKILQEYESPEHYNFNYKRAFPRIIKEYVESQLNTFSREKLGYGKDPREVKREMTRNAEQKALAAINRVANKFGFSGGGIGKSKSGGGGGGGAGKSIRLYMPEMKLPREQDYRVNYGEKIENITCTVINDENSFTSVRLKMYLLFNDREIKVFHSDDYTISPQSKLELPDLFSLYLDPNQFEAGEYTVVSRINSIMTKNKGDKLDEKKKKFWLERDPPKAGLFESCDGIEYPEEVLHQMGEAFLGEKGGYKLQYNIIHPEYETVQNIEESAAEYLYRLLAFELCRIDIDRDDSKIFSEKDKENPDALLRKLLDSMGRLSYEFYTR